MLRLAHLAVEVLLGREPQRDLKPTRRRGRNRAPQCGCRSHRRRCAAPAAPAGRGALRQVGRVMGGRARSCRGDGAASNHVDLLPQIRDLSSHLDPLRRPAGCCGPGGQGLLQLCALLVLGHQLGALTGRAPYDLLRLWQWFEFVKGSYSTKKTF